MWEEDIVWFGLFGFYGISTFVGYLMPNLFLYKQTVLFQAIQFSISTKFTSIWPKDMTLSGATTPHRSVSVNEGVLYIPQRSSITGTSPSDLMSYLGHSLWLFFFFCFFTIAENQLVYSTAETTGQKRLCCITCFGRQVSSFCLLKLQSK